MKSPDGMERVFDAEFIVSLLREAADIVEEVSPAKDLRPGVLAASIAMVGQMTRATNGGVEIPQMRIEGGKLL